MKRASNERHETLDERLAKNTEYPDLTKELRTTGKLTHFITKKPKIQDIERKCLLQLEENEDDLRVEHENFISQLKMLEAGQPKDLMNMSMETLQKLLESVRGKPCQDFSEILEYMGTLTASQIEETVKKEEAKNSRLNSVPEESEGFWSPESGSVSKASSVVGRHVFPTASEMADSYPKYTPSTPAGSVYQFGSTISSTNKAPRLLKPGEVAYSETGSPLMMPRLGRVDRKAETIPVNDADGKKIVEVVLYRGEEDKEKQYKDYVTDIRCLVATKSIKQSRIRPPRLPRGPKDPGSASKKPVWY